MAVCLKTASYTRGAEAGWYSLNIIVYAIFYHANDI